MQTSVPVLTLLGGILIVPLVSNADCASRIQELRASQAKTPYLDPERPDLEKLRQVAQHMASQGQEALCLELVKQLEAAVKEHREHAHTLQQVEKYATPVAIGSYAEQLDTSRLIGMSVRNRVGEELGVVQGVVIDTQEGGRANALVIEHGGFLGMGETRVEVPWKDVQITRDGSSIVLDMTAEALNEQPEAE